MPLATSSLILQNTSLDLILLPLDANYGVPSRTVSFATLALQQAQIIGDTSISVLSSTANTPVFLRQGTSLSFSGSTAAPFRRQVIVNEDKVVGTSATTLSVTPLLRPLVSGSDPIGRAIVPFVSNHADLVIAACSTTSGSPTITTTNSFANVEVGDFVTGTGIPTNAYVVSKASNTSLTISANASATGSAVALTFISRVTPTPLTGIQTLDLNNQETQVDTTHFGSGAGTEAAIVRFNRSYSASGIALIGDEALERIVKRVAGFDNAFLGRELYAVSTTSDGESIHGVAKIMALNLPANQNEVKKYSFTLMYQGNAAWVQPYSY